MRTLMFLVVMASVAALGYVYAPKLIESNYRPGDDPAPASVAAPEDGVAQAAPSPIQESVKAITRQAPEPKEEVKSRKAGPKSGRQKSGRAPKSRIRSGRPSGQSAATGAGSDTMDAVSAQEIERVTGLKPAKAEPKLARADEPKAKLLPRRQDNPLKSRWIDDLSGQRVRIDMGKKSTEDGCAAAYANCERPPAPKDISVAGVVVKTENLAKEPASPLEGRVTRGNYIDNTPAIYVK